MVARHRRVRQWECERCDGDSGHNFPRLLCGGNNISTDVEPSLRVWWEQTACCLRAEGLGYLNDRWNLFDFIIVAGSCVAKVSNALELSTSAAQKRVHISVPFSAQYKTFSKYAHVLVRKIKNFGEFFRGFLVGLCTPVPRFVCKIVSLQHSWGKRTYIPGRSSRQCQVVHYSATIPSTPASISLA